MFCQKFEWWSATASCDCESAFCNAKLLLLDEPFSNLDYSRKMELRERLFNYAKEHELSVMISTHEIQEIFLGLTKSLFTRRKIDSK